tara:strand:+ start:214 stop:336 length:123 start_codon:yes stop_codon:yes gene_type:complete
MNSAIFRATMLGRGIGALKNGRSSAKAITRWGSLDIPSGS